MEMNQKPRSLEEECNSHYSKGKLNSLTLAKLDSFAKEKNIKPEGKVKKADLVTVVEQYFKSMNN